MISYAQNFEDVMLERAFKQQATGFFIDIGVWDATLDSVTKHFYDKGWSGINVEPLPDNYQRIVAARPRDINLNLAASNHHGPLVFHHVRDTGLSTSRADYAGRHADMGLDVSEITVPTRTLKEICAEHAAATVIDFMKIDVEGAEADVIDSGDWDAHRPRIVLVEATLPNSPIESFSDWEPVLLEHGYEFAYFDGLNRFYYREEESQLRNFFRAPPNVFDDFVLYRTYTAEHNVYRLESQLRSAMQQVNEFDKFRKTLLGRVLLPLLRTTRSSQLWGTGMQGQTKTHEIAPKFGINLIGYVSANIGLGHAAREFAHVILSSGVPLSILDINTGDGRSKFDLSFAAYTVETAKELPYGVNLVMVGANALADWLIESPDGPADETRLSAAFLWWELPNLAPHWIEAARAFDVLIAGSEYIQATLANTVPGVPVLLARQPVRMPNQVPPNRARFGLPAEALLFYTGFEPYSDPIRKNPFGAIEAFQRAFPSDSHCRLVIKINNPDAYSASGGLLKKLHEKVQDDSRILLLKESLPYEDLLSLYASCDVFISLHRSEGLGLVPLEAMRLGKAVVATGWSGNMSYMNHRNACLVTYELQPTDDRSPLYGPSNLGIRSHWAEPDLDHAAAWLRKLATDPNFRAAIGTRAAEDSARYEALAQRADFIDQIKAIWERRELYPKRDRNLVLSRIRQARHQMHLNQLGPVRRFATKFSEHLQQQMDRHILWRFHTDHKRHLRDATRVANN